MDHGGRSSRAWRKCAGTRMRVLPRQLPAQMVAPGFASQACGGNRIITARVRSISVPKGKS